MFTLKQFFVRYLGLGLRLIWIICKKGCILIEYLVHLFVHVLVSLESSLCFAWLFSGFQKEEGEEEADSRNNISFN